jgi:hypothetical protein
VSGFIDIQGEDALTSTSNPFSYSAFDNSGWNVNFGSGRIDSARTETPVGSVPTSYLPYIAAAVGALLLWRMTRKHA